ncbi:hypothetical protein W97_04734 [Coniosporium apollinis CBS 100218]|uniref:Translation elongation factor EF1B beta/delta subunit guanine nucleotide exchange domain-containing protein n=1 Tax=Coniosporium apollinis (strain CBS 100218) TaxID=1168221 RepID=R7YUZ3_CONA1|nr:uncharacterized protein W97_04734 [Coniosporium apollinis CBS 100218]EON65496.1 hypothetical protein W97_04734 [Coniosporium apollinis CBS 100218]
MSATSSTASNDDEDTNPAPERPSMRKEIKDRLVELTKQQAPCHCLLGRLSSEFPNMTAEERQLVLDATSASHTAAAQRMEEILNETPETPEVAKAAYILEITPTSKVPIALPSGVLLGYYPQKRLRSVDPTAVLNSVRGIEIPGLEWRGSSWVKHRAYVYVLRIGLVIEDGKLELEGLQSVIEKLEQVRTTQVIDNRGHDALLRLR